MKLHISPMLIPLAVVSVVTGSSKLLIMAYLSAALHEAAHLIAAVCMGLKPESVSLSPFGAHLTLKNKIVHSVSDEIILYGAGPLASGIAALVGTYINNDMLYAVNMGLMIINILPFMPLDGGVILKRILSYHIGARTARRVLTAFSAAAGAMFLIFAALSWYWGHINPSAFIMAVFLLGNIVTGREMYDLDLINNISVKKRTDRTRLVILNDKHTMLDALGQVSPRYTLIGAKKEENGSITLIHEEEMVKNLLKF